MTLFFKTICVSGAVLWSTVLQGCIAQKTEEPLITNDNEAVWSDSYTNSYHNSSAKNFFCYKSLEGEKGETSVLDYESMNSISLCNKPNCKHKDKGCIVKRLDGNVPVFAENCAYYFVDEEPQILENEEGKYDLKLSSNLYCYDLGTNIEKKLLHVDASVSESCYGLLLHDNILYYVENQYSRSYDDAGNILTSGNTGGKMSLHSVRLSDMQRNDLSELYDCEKINEFYPLAKDSGEVYMMGLHDNKIYFNVGFVTQGKGSDPPTYRFYVTYYDLTDGTYHGTPEDYEHIDFAGVTYCSDDYLVICSTGQASVWKKGVQTPVVLDDERFDYNYQLMSVFDDTVFCFGSAFDLNTKEERKIADLAGKSVVARYGDSYIISDIGMQRNFEKIPAEKLLN